MTHLPPRAPRHARGAALAVLLLAATLVGLACARRDAHPVLPPILVASDRLLLLEPAAGRTLGQRLLPAPATDLALDAAGRVAGIATLRGAALVRVPSLEVVWHEELGIVDAIELSPAGDRAYLLLHPGPDPAESAADHTVIEIAVPEGGRLREVALSPRAYDLRLDPETGALYVTDLVGRTIHSIDLTTFAVAAHTIGRGGPPAAEPRGALIRLLLAGRRPGELIAVEDLRTAARLWSWAPQSARLEPHPLDGVEPPVLGGGPLDAGDSPAYWLFTRESVFNLDAELGITARIALRSGAAADSALAYRFGAARGSTAVLLAPAPPIARGPRARLAWVDLAAGRLEGERLLDLRAGPLALLPAAAPASPAAAAGR